MYLRKVLSLQVEANPTIFDSDEHLILIAEKKLKMTIKVGNTYVFLLYLHLSVKLAGGNFVYNHIGTIPIRLS